MLQRPPRTSFQSFLQSLALVFRRAPKDARARREIYRVIGLAAYVGYMAFWISPAFRRDPSGEYLGWPVLIGLGISLLGLTLVSLYHRYRPPESADHLQTLGLSSPVAPAPAESGTAPSAPTEPVLREEFAQLALFLAVWTERGRSELLFRRGVFPEGAEVITRRTHLELLRRYGLLDKVRSSERELLYSTDGHWESSVIEASIREVDATRVLRWVLRLDPYLPPVTASLSPDSTLASSLISDPAPLFEDRRLVDLADLRVAVASADQSLYRVWAEALRRGLITAENSQAAEQAVLLAEHLRDRESEDVLLGDTIVSKAPDELVLYATDLALRRFRLLEWVRDRMYGVAEPLEALHSLD